MNQKILIRAWRDPVFRASLPKEILLEMPAHPSGESGENEMDWVTQLGAITLGSGCGSAGCSRVVCTDPCGTLGDCPRRTQNTCRTICGCD